ncbi:prepilin-type N-terminal cleavage/methylation domain-containing protein [Rhodopirellula halodulae]|uniref:prepilin-type N-terminal cleavage/methylation domain-containing protein n=1 Tax=Rhodopirellula halodulae TaxID=2894198 RepID=UPI001E5359B5|nr:prepilin-type N-terminal cleavage/methylation domain-containing protein [Rhodopirellula sp. JC737]MCC9655858.1 prepilin-type N-terminal cleavage/methylation domain-containing protein [Rhodopirellula sp. JC737]
MILAAKIQDPWNRVSIRHAVRNGLTLVELLIVMSVFLLVSAIALPTFRNLISDQKVSQTSRTIVAYLDEARSRAIAEGRFVGVRIDRYSNDASVDFRTSAGGRLRQLIGVPPYSGEAANSRVRFNYPTSGATTATLEFSGVDNQLLVLYTDTNSSLYNKKNAPVKTGDWIELPGGRYFQINFTSYDNLTDTVTATIDLNSTRSGTATFPVIHEPLHDSSVKYKIHRAPVISTSQSLVFGRGIVVDMNYSGIGIDGNQFAPQSAVANQSIDIVFGPDGRVEYASSDSIGTRSLPSGMIYLCVGETDGVQPSTPFNSDSRTPANLMNSDSVWIVINPSTGRSVVAPNAAVNSTASMAAALREGRSLASLSDTLDANP